jgi:hypothetical protein
MPGRTASEGEQLRSAMCSLARLSFRRQDIPAVRRFAAQFGIRAGIRGGQSAADFVLAVSESAACVLSQSPGTARLRLWSTGARVHCEVRGEGMPPVHGPGGAEQGDADALRRGLLRRICDHVSFESGPHGMTVRFSVTVV